ncbi:hypothetical protein ACFUVV_10900 [Streptomyces sp. NPDC057376]|uniref:hypothetical protein n=1 Tax=unclassified Streptomyces TaxID=2593676 RepID=UPI00093B0254|nr:hypothetical protein [Streptomyces sp. CB02414]OKI87844.1 hypothetical protein AMK11_06455 [Streptomyces sp. CB02414]
MTASGPNGGATPNEPDEPGGVPPVSEDVWRKFLEDDERAIRASAFREPAARERTPGWRPVPPPAAVGELWRPEDPWPGPGWRELDGRARVRRIGRVIGTAAAVALALTAWSQLSTGPGTPPGGGPADTIGRRLEESPVLPSAATPAPTASTATTPAAFEPDPSAVPRASLSPWTYD